MESLRVAGIIIAAETNNSSLIYSHQIVHDACSVTQCMPRVQVDVNLGFENIEMSHTGISSEKSALPYDTKILENHIG